MEPKNQWEEHLERLLSSPERDSLVAHLVAGLAEGLDALIFQDGLERAEEVLKNHGAPLFAAHTEESTAETEDMDNLSDMFDKLIEGLKSNFSAERLDQLRQLISLQNEFAQKAKDFMHEFSSGKPEERSSESPEQPEESRNFKEPLNSEEPVKLKSFSFLNCLRLIGAPTIGMLLGGGVGAALTLGKGAGLFRGLANVSAGAFLGGLTGAAVDGFAEKIAEEP